MRFRGIVNVNGIRAFEVGYGDQVNMFELRNERTVETLLLTVRQASRSLNISARTLWTLTANGEIQAVRFGRSVRYDPADLKKWIETKKNPQPPLDIVHTTK